jgi:uncharacterized protein
MNDFSGYNTAHPLPVEPPLPLTHAKCDGLFSLFNDAGLPASAMSAEMANGYLTACVIGPINVPSHEWMTAIFDQSKLPVFADEQQHDIETLTSAARNTLAPDALSGRRQQSRAQRSLPMRRRLTPSASEPAKSSVHGRPAREFFNPGF